MSWNMASMSNLRRVFHQGFFVHDIAEPLVSFDESAMAEDVRAFMEARRYEVVGIRREGLVAGYVQRADLVNGTCADYLRPWEDALVVPDTMPLADLVLRINDRPRLFVAMLGRVGGIVTRTDLQKPPVRMWLFGMVTLIEMRLSRLIERCYLADDWKSLLSASRIAKAEALLAERARRQQDLTLLDCIQLSDKAQIIARNEKLRGMTRFQSRRQLEEAAKMLERLRNNLAHAQDIISTDWETIVALSERLDAILVNPADHVERPPIA